MWRLFPLLLPTLAEADSLVATRVIRPQEPLTAESVALVAAEIAGAIADPAEAIGQEARVAIYPGRPIRAQDLGPPARVERNQIVPLSFRSGVLVILTEGRALARGGAGEMIEVLNLSSKAKVMGRINPEGGVDVLP